MNYVKYIAFTEFRLYTRCARERVRQFAEDAYEKLRQSPVVWELILERTTPGPAERLPRPEDVLLLSGLQRGK